MNRSLFFSTYKRSLRMFAIFTVLLALYLLSIITMFSGEDNDPFAMLPDAMREAFGIEAAAGGLTFFLATGFYGITFVLFMMIYCVIVANQFISQLVDRGSMAYLLSTPVSRKKVALTQASVLIVHLFLMTLFTTLIGLLMSPVLLDDAPLDVPAFIRINIAGFLLFLVMSGYSFLLSCLCNDSKQTLAASGLVTVLFYGIHIVSNMSDNWEWLRNFTILSAFQPAGIAAGTFEMLPAALTLGATGVVLYGLAVWIFSRRDLPL
ncbi:ABC transporter permease subunit [Paenibacillus tarimensis]